MVGNSLSFPEPSRLTGADDRQRELFRFPGDDLVVGFLESEQDIGQRTGDLVKSALFAKPLQRHLASQKLLILVKLVIHNSMRRFGSVLFRQTIHKCRTTFQLLAHPCRDRP